MGAGVAKEARSMRICFRTALFASTIALLTAAGARGAAAQQPQHDAGTHHHPEAAKLKNPVRATDTSIAAGKKLYDAQCASCHGTTGKGDGKGGALLKPPPSDMTDANWKHGSSDGEIFVLIRDGAKQTGMRGYGGRIADNDIWNIVNYVRTLAPKTTKSN
jgi:mono/diheme cytochrome c family protein